MDELHFECPARGFHSLVRTCGLVLPYGAVFRETCLNRYLR